MMCASFRTIMFRQIAGRAVTGSGTARSNPAIVVRRDAEHFVEAGGAQPGGGRPPLEFGDRVGVGALDTAGPIQACGVEHRRAAGHRIGEDVAAGIGGAAHRVSRLRWRRSA